MSRLIKDIEEIKKYVRVSSSLNLTELEPALEETETDIIEYYLGSDLMAEVVAWYESTFTATPLVAPRIEAIFRYIQRADACLSLVNAADELEVNISDNGILRQETTNEKTAFAGQIARLKTKQAERGWSAIDKMLQTLEDYEQDYPEWAGSSYYQEKDLLIFRNAKEFSSFESIKNSCLTFRAFFTYMRDIQEQRIKKALPAELYKALQTEPVSTDNMQLLNLYIKPALAKYCVFQALQELPVLVDHEGVTVNQVEMAGTENRTRKNVPNEYLERKIWALEGKGKTYLADMVEYLNENASETKYPLWFNSSFYDEPLSKKIAANQLTNEERKIYRA